jgi:hypothetical protein
VLKAGFQITAVAARHAGCDVETISARINAERILLT